MFLRINVLSVRRYRVCGARPLRRYPVGNGPGRSRIDLHIPKCNVALFKKRDRPHLAWPGAVRVKSLTYLSEIWNC